MALAADQAPAVGRDLDGAAQVYVHNPVLGRFLGNPKVRISNKKEILAAVLDQCARVSFASVF
jgi:F0F1-type ATP synthase delta subunit